MRYYSTNRRRNDELGYLKIPEEERKRWETALKKKKKNERFDRFVATIADFPLKELSDGKCFYEQEWVHVKGYPRNCVTGVEFMGGENAVYCMVAQYVRGYKNPVWIQSNAIMSERKKRNSIAAKTGIEQPIIFIAEPDDVVYENVFSKEGESTTHVSLYNIEQVVNPPEIEDYPEPLLYITKDREKILDAHLENMAEGLGLTVTHNPYCSESKCDKDKKILELPPKSFYPEPEAYYCGAFYELSRCSVQMLEKDMGKTEHLSAEISTIMLCHMYGIGVNLDEKKLQIKDAVREFLPLMKREKVWYTSVLRDGGMAADYVINHNRESIRKRNIFNNITSFELQNLMPDEIKRPRGSGRHV